MHYQILAKHSDDKAPLYRGVARYAPSYDETQPQDSPRNRAWRRLVDCGERVETQQEALSLADQLAVQVDVIGVQSDVREQAASGLQSLGYDVASNGRESILSWGILWDESRKLASPLGRVLRLIEAYFQPRLNEWGLFADWEAAEMFRDVILAVQSLVPNVWEAPGHYHPEVLRISAVRLAHI